MSVSEEAVGYIKDNRKRLIEKFASPLIYPKVKNPDAFFMAGSPGAGKTEYSKSFIENLETKQPARKIVRIDADEIRDFLPMYNKNSTEIQGAASLGVEKLLDHVLKNKQEFLLDATFSNYELSHKNVTRSISHNYRVGLEYIYQDPIDAWKFTKRREEKEGRKVPKKVFIDAFFNAKENVNRIKRELGSSVDLNLIIKNYNQGVEKFYINIDNVDNYLKFKYNLESLEEKINDK